MNDIRRTILWVIFGFSMVLLWDKWQLHNGNKATFFPSPAAVGAAAPAAPGLCLRCLALLPGSAPAATEAPPARHGPATPARPHRCRSGVPGSTGPAPGLWPGPAHHETAGRWPRAGVMLARTTPSPEAPNLCQRRGQCPPPPGRERWQWRRWDQRDGQAWQALYTRQALAIAVRQALRE